MSPLPLACHFDALQKLPSLPESAAASLRRIVGPSWLLENLTDRLAYCRDRLPWGTFRLREGVLPAQLPSAVVMPADGKQVQEVVRLANAMDLPLIPFGAGSGVLGGALPLGQELMVDLKRLNRIECLNEQDGTVTVQAGMNGA